METHCIPAAEVPSNSALYKTFFTEYQKVSAYYSHPPKLEEILVSAAEVRYRDQLRKDVGEVLRRQNRAFGGDAATSVNLDRFEKGASAIVTGQQVGLFGGPAYCVYKALSAIRMAKDLTARGLEAVPIFWLATEDHDFEEVNHCFFSARGDVQRFELPPAGLPGRRVGEIELGEPIRELCADAAATLEGTAASELTQWLTESYSPRETFGSAFAKLMTRLLAGRGLIFLDPMDPALHRFAAPILRHALVDHRVLNADLLARSAALEEAGFHAQVKVAEQNTLLFRIVDGQRQALRVHNGQLAVGARQESAEQMAQALESHPEEFSPNALLRPVMQDALLPTVAYFGGPAEIAYHAQASVVYRRLLERAPVVLPRAGFTVVPKHAGGILRKYGLTATDVFAGRTALRAKLEAAVLPEKLTQRFEQGEAQLRGLFDGLREPVSKLDPTLIGALDTAAEKMLYQWNGVRAKAGRAEGFRTGVLEGHEREILNTLLPNGALQERSLSLLPFLASEGLALLDTMEKEMKPGTGEHCILYL